MQVTEAAFTLAPGTSGRAAGDLLREWRQHRRMSQLELALETGISTRHLSFIETGRAAPSRRMLLQLAERLEVPLRERNRLLVAAGFAPVFGERPLSDPAMQSVREAIELVLEGHEPYPALAVDRGWNMISANTAIPPLLAGVDASLLEPPVNVLRLSLHPDGLAPRIVNLGQWRAHLLARLQRDLEASADAALRSLLEELRGLPHEPRDAAGAARADLAPGTRGVRTGHREPDPPPGAIAGGIVVPLQLVVDGEVLAFFSTTTVFGTPLDVTLAELAIESFFPADARTAQRLRGADRRTG